MVDDVRNFIGGQETDFAYDKRAEIIDPSTGEAFATAPISREAEVDRGVRGGRRRLRRAGGTPHPPSGAWRCCGSRTRSRPAPTNSSRPSRRTPASRSG